MNKIDPHVIYLKLIREMGLFFLCLKIFKHRKYDQCVQLVGLQRRVHSEWRRCHTK